MELHPNFDVLAQMRNLTIVFLDNDSQCCPFPLKHHNGDTLLIASSLQGLLPAPVDVPYDLTNQLVRGVAWTGWWAFVFAWRN